MFCSGNKTFVKSNLISYFIKKWFFEQYNKSFNLQPPGPQEHCPRPHRDEPEPEREPPQTLQGLLKYNCKHLPPS